MHALQFHCCVLSSLPLTPDYSKVVYYTTRSTSSYLGILHLRPATRMAGLGRRSNGHWRSKENMRVFITVHGFVFYQKLYNFLYWRFCWPEIAVNEYYCMIQYSQWKNRKCVSLKRRLMVGGWPLKGMWCSFLCKRALLLDSSALCTLLSYLIL